MKKTITIALFLTALSPLLGSITVQAERKGTSHNTKSSLFTSDSRLTFNSQKSLLSIAEEIYQTELESIIAKWQKSLNIAKTLPTAFERNQAQEQAHIAFKASKKMNDLRFKMAQSNISQLFSSNQNL